MQKDTASKPEKQPSARARQRGLLGLGILGIEFAWARIWLRRVKAKGQDVMRSLRGDKQEPPRDVS